MAKIIITTLLLCSYRATGAGGIPLESNDMLTLHQKILIKTQRDKLDRQLQWEQTMARIVPVNNEPLDPEYVAILEEYDRIKESFKLSHRDLQWHIVAKVMRDIDDVDDRLGLIETVRHNPLWRSLPPTVAISSINLRNWNTARTMFFAHLRRIK